MNRSFLTAASRLIGLALCFAFGKGWAVEDHASMRDESQAARAETGALYQEAYRPQFHFTAQKNWLNDPNGLVFYKGEYHLFFQHNPAGLGWGEMEWGHAVSRDLIHWEQLPDAILPDRLGTCWSGSAVVDRDNTAGFQQGDEKALVAVYTAAGDTSAESKGQPFTQCLAYSTDRGRVWQKYAQNPVLPHIIGGDRDPKVAWYAPARRWIMTLYLDGNDFGFFSSPDLKHWTRLHDITVADCGECPDFFEIPVGGRPGLKKWVWTAANGRYLIGNFDGERFMPDGGLQRVEWGANCYAVQTFSDIPASDGRRIQMAWMRDGRYPDMPFNQQMAFPCELTLHAFPDGLRLCKRPAREIGKLHGKEQAWHDLTLRPGENPLSALSGELFDIRAEIDPGETTTVGIRARGATVEYKVREKTLSALGCSAPLEPAHHRIHLQLLVDRTSLEVYGNNGEVALTSCFLPDSKDRNLEIYATGGEVRILSLQVYPLHSIWTNR
ncbi:MAG TPA: glycoside hydrolase family 32 protein [Chthonomonadaceae bacterium]|nr:glycoside hydrolase family 32 protein [Chthonomonadaceae bacterium]